MAKKKSKHKKKQLPFFARVTQAVTAPFRTVVAQIIGFVILIAGIIAAGQYGWERVAVSVRNDPRFLISADQIHTPQQPDWIQDDVKAEVVASDDLAQVSVLDRQAVDRVANAFATHPWVEEVERVEKHDGPRIDVTMTYRMPVAMVEVYTATGRGLLPVDRHSVLLPPDDFSPKQARDFLRISAGRLPPSGTLGAPWGDPRVEGAARVAEAWKQQWRELELYRIVTFAGAAADTESIQYEIHTREGARVLWGRAPGSEQTGEATASEKIERLEAFVHKHGPIAASDSSALVIDLRDTSGVTHRVASRPADPTR